MQIGWISLHRSLMEHWVYKEKPFCKLGAWVDLLLMVNHTDNKMVVGNRLTTIKRGQTFTSYRSLAARWGWGVERIKAFLSLLKSDNMIELKTTTHGTLLTIVNYGFYQDQQHTDGTQTERRPAHGQNADPHTVRTQTERNNNSNNENNGNNDNKENNATSNSASPSPKKKYGAYKHVTLTDEEYNRLCVDYGQDMTEKAIDYLDAYIEEKGYKAKNHNLTLRRWVFDAVKKKDGNGVKPQKPKSLMETWGLTKEDFKT